jgi:hypothetical protein
LEVIRSSHCHWCSILTASIYLTPQFLTLRIFETFFALAFNPQLAALAGSSPFIIQEMSEFFHPGIIGLNTRPVLKALQISSMIAC